MTIQQIIKQAKAKESWSVNGKYNYAPIYYLEEQVFKKGTTRTQFNRFYRNVRNVTDAKTYFVFMFKNFDIYVWCSSLVYGMKQTFPEVSISTIKEWVYECAEEHHLIMERYCLDLGLED